MKFELREWQLSDYKSLAESANNINIWNNLRDYFPYPYSETNAQEFIAKVFAGEMGIQQTIVIDGEAVGGIGAFPKTDVERITAEIGYWLGEKYWSRGIMTAAVKQMTNYVFENFIELHKLFAPVFDFNLASQRVLQKAGFEREAILKRAYIKNGVIIDEHYYSIFRDL